MIGLPQLILGFFSYMYMKNTRKIYEKYMKNKPTHLGNHTHHVSKENYHISKKPIIHQKKPIIHQKRPIIHQNSPIIHQKRPIIHQKKPMIHQKRPTSCLHTLVATHMSAAHASSRSRMCDFGCDIAPNISV